MADSRWQKPIPDCQIVDMIDLLAQDIPVTGCSYFGQLDPTGLLQEPPVNSKTLAQTLNLKPIFDMNAFLITATLIITAAASQAQQKSECKVYDAKYGTKTGSPTQIIETDKNGVSKVYDAKYGVKTDSPTQIIEKDKNGVSQVYDAKYGVKTGSPTKIIETDKNGVSKVYDAKYGVKTGPPKAITETK